MDRVLLETLHKNFTLNNLDELIDQCEITSNLGVTSVELWRLHGSGLDTPSFTICKDKSP